MTAELVVALVLALAAVWFVLRPIFRPDIAVGALDSGVAGMDEDVEVSPQAASLRALKEIEFDRATGKLTEADYTVLKAKYTTAALAALRDREEPRPDRTHSRAAVPACPEHGSPGEPDAAFCSVCGRRLASAVGFCSQCGTTLERDATFCSGCGVRVAA